MTVSEVAAEVAAVKDTAATPESRWSSLFDQASLPDQPALNALRERARERFAERGFPTSREESWRFTNPAPIVRTEVRLAQRQPLDAAEQVEARELLIDGCRNLVFVDGSFDAGLSDECPDGLTLETLSGGTGADALAHLGTQIDPGSEHVNAWALLNTALFGDAALLRVAKGAVVEEPVHLLYLTRAAEDDAIRSASFPRCSIVSGTNSQATVLESHATLGTGESLSFPVTEIDAEDNGRLEHYRVIRESEASRHVSSQHVRCGRDANVRSLTVCYGGGLVRCDVGALLDGPGGECTLNGLYIVRNRQHFDTHMRVEHKAPHCNSYELYKGILDGRARAVFNGLIYVHDGAQKTDAKQTNRNLMLSSQAMVNSNPQLEIFADDVRCTHGSTTGHLEEEAVFYLRSRGIDAEAAKSVLTYAFASELTETISVDVLRAQIEDVLVSRLAGGEIVRAVSGTGEGG